MDSVDTESDKLDIEGSADSTVADSKAIKMEPVATGFGECYYPRDIEVANMEPVTTTVGECYYPRDIEVAKMESVTTTVGECYYPRDVKVEVEDDEERAVDGTESTSAVRVTQKLTVRLVQVAPEEEKEELPGKTETPEHCLTIDDEPTTTYGPDGKRNPIRWLMLRWVAKVTENRINTLLTDARDATCIKCQYQAPNRRQLRIHISQHYIRHYCRCQYASESRDSVYSHQVKLDAPGDTMHYQKTGVVYAVDRLSFTRFCQFVQWTDHHKFRKCRPTQVGERDSKEAVPKKQKTSPTLNLAKKASETPLAAVGTLLPYTVPKRSEPAVHATVTVPPEVNDTSASDDQPAAVSAEPSIPRPSLLFLQTSNRLAEGIEAEVSKLKVNLQQLRWLLIQGHLNEDDTQVVKSEARLITAEISRLTAQADSLRGDLF